MNKQTTTKLTSLECRVLGPTHGEMPFEHGNLGAAMAKARVGKRSDRISMRLTIECSHQHPMKRPTSEGAAMKSSGGSLRRSENSFINRLTALLWGLALAAMAGPRTTDRCQPGEGPGKKTELSQSAKGWLVVWSNLGEARTGCVELGRENEVEKVGKKARIQQPEVFMGHPGNTSFGEQERILETDNHSSRMSDSGALSL